MVMVPKLWILYIDDVIAQLEYLIENINGLENKCYDIGTGHGVSIFDVCKKNNSYDRK